MSKRFIFEHYSGEVERIIAPSLGEAVRRSAKVTSVEDIKKIDVVNIKNPFIKDTDDIISEFEKRTSCTKISRGEGRPKRDNVITKDDITNLVISLNKSKSLKEFLQSV